MDGFVWRRRRDTTLSELIRDGDGTQGSAPRNPGLKDGHPFRMAQPSSKSAAQRRLDLLGNHFTPCRQSRAGVPPARRKMCCRHLAGRTHFQETSNIERWTTNAEGFSTRAPSAFSVRCSLFDVSNYPPFPFHWSPRASEGQAGRLPCFTAALPAKGRFGSFSISQQIYSSFCLFLGCLPPVPRSPGSRSTGGYSGCAPAAPSKKKSGDYPLFVIFIFR